MEVECEHPWKLRKRLFQRTQSVATLPPPAHIFPPKKRLELAAYLKRVGNSGAAEQTSQERNLSGLSQTDHYSAHVVVVRSADWS